LEAFDHDEDGATLTEFIITLPVLLLVFSAIIQMGAFQEKSVKVWVNASGNMWETALTEPESQTSPYANAGSAAAMGVNQLGQNQVHREAHTSVARTTQAEARKYSNMGQSGYWGESAARVQPARNKGVEVWGVDDNISTDSSEVLGESNYASAMLDDGPGQLGAAQLAGLRYGTAEGVHEESLTFMNLTMDMRAHFNTAVSPTGGSEPLAAARARQELDNLDPYDKLSGIADDQPLSEEEIEVEPVAPPEDGTGGQP
jgi:hypothetical protein